MKKLRGIMAILAATALIFGTVACSDGGGNDNNNNKTPTDQSDPISGGGGSGESDPISGGGGSSGGNEGGSTTVDPVTYKWSFNEDTFDASKFITVKNSGGADKYGLAEDYEYASTPSGMVMTLKAATGGDAHYNLVDKTKTIGSSTVYYGTATVGCIEPNGDLVVLKNVQGPFTVTAYVQCNSSSDKTDRYGYIKIGEEEFADASYKASTTLPAAGQVLTAKYDSSDKVDVVIGCAKIMRIYDVVVTTAATQDQSTAETNAGSMTISADKTSAKVGSKVTWTLTANNMDVPSTVDIYVDSSSTPFITGAALTDGKYEMTVKEAWLETDEDDDPIETTVKVFVKSGNVSSNKVTITFVPADETTVYKDGSVADFEKDFTDDEIAYISAMTDAEIESFIAGVYTDADCTTPVTEGYEGDIWIKLNKTKEELKALIDAAIAAATKYTVTFDANGGVFAANATTSVEVVSGLTVSTEQLATISEPAKTDYTFLGWATTADATEAADLSTVTISDATTLYAVWKSKIYVLTGESGKFSLGKTNVGTIGETANAGGSEYLSVATDNWSSENTIGDYTDVFYNLNGTARNITAKVKGVAAFTLYVKNSTANRAFTVKIGDGAAETINHPGKQTISGTETDIIPFTFNTGSTDELSIVIGGGSDGSVYPGYIVAYSAAQTIPVETVEITGAPTAAVLLADGSVQLGATVAPARATEKTLTWTSDATGVATVDSTGKVTFVGAGTTTITATAPSGVKDEVTIVVQAAVVNVTGIVVKDSSDATSGTVNAGDKITLTATVSPDDASNKAVTWSSSNEGAATVADGVVTAVAAGTATITATAADGSGVSGSYEVTVKAVTTATYFVFESGATYSGDATVVGDYFTAGTATWGNAEGFGITASSVTVGKNSASVYGAYFTGDMSYTAETDGLWVTVPITTTEAVELANVTGEFRNNKTDNVQVVIYVDDTLVETIGSSSKLASLKLSNPVSLSAGNHTVKIAVQGKSGKTEKKTGCKLEFNSIVISVGK